MSEHKDAEDKSESTGYLSAPNWTILLLMMFFGICALLFPDLWLAAAIAGLVSVLAVYLSTSNDQPKRVQPVHKINLDSVNAGRQEVLEALQFPAFVLDRDGRVRHSNKSSFEAFGSVAKGDQLTVRFRQPEFRSSLSDALQKRRLTNFEYNESVPNDRRFQVSLAPFSGLAGASSSREDAFLLVFNDQTEAKRTDQMRSDFIANASHELRTPLASILGFIETIRGPAKNDPAAIERFTTVMLDQAERMTRLLNDLLSLSQIEIKARVSPTEQVELTQVLKSVTSALEQAAGELGVELVLDLESDFVVVGESDSLIQVFYNLVENACKYGQDGKRVEVSATRLPDGEPKVRVSIRDYGPGIALEHQHRITERFYRVDVARSREKQGTGLGLAIVKNILQRHGARLRIRSQPGEGAEFSVDLTIANVKE